MASRLARGALPPVLGLLFASGAWAADLSVSGYTWSPDPATRGGLSTFTVEATNNDVADTVSNLTLVVELPDNLDFSGSVAPTDCAFNLAVSPKLLTCTRSSLAAQAVWSTQFMGTGATAGVASTSASISAAGNVDANPGNDELIKNTTVINGANLSITKAGPASAISGDVINFTLTVSNVDGPDPATTFRVIDNLPATSDFTYQSYSGSNWSCALVSTTLTCDYSGPNLASGATAPVITVTGRIITSAGTITNGASVVSTDSATGDPVSGNNGPSLKVVSVTAGTSLRANKTMVSTATGLTTYATGEAVTLTLSATNLGPQSATGVVLSDSVSSDFSIGVLPGGCSAVGQDITCTVGALNNGATSSNFVIPLTVTGAPVSGTNTATISRATPASGTNQSATVNYTIASPYAHLTLTKSKGPTPVAAGGNITNTIVVSNSNSSTSTATGIIRVTDALSANEIYVSASGSNWSCSASGSPQTVTCDNSNPGGLARGASLPTLTLTTQAAAGFLGTLSNTACTGLSAGSPHLPADNSASGNCETRSVTGTDRTAVDLAMAKSASLATLDTATNSYSYTLTVSNLGADVAPTAVVTDTLQAWYSGNAGTTGGSAAITGAQPGESCSFGSTVTCTLLNVSNGAPRSISITVNRPIQSGSIANTASVASPDAIDSNGGNNSASADITVDPVADVTVTNMASAPNPVKVGVQLTYTTSIRNNGPSTAAGVVLRQRIDPARMSYVPASAAIAGSAASCGYVTFVGAPYAGDQGIECTGFSLTNGETRQLVFKVIPVYPYPDLLDATYTSNASIGTTTVESDAPGYANNSSSNNVTVTTEAIDLTVTNNDPGYDPTAFGDHILYQVVAQNNGPSQATGFKLIVTPTAPPQGTQPNPYTMAYNAGGSSLPVGATCGVVGVDVVCYLGADQASSVLAASSNKTFTLRFDTGPLANVPASSLTYKTTAAVESYETGASPFANDSLPGNNSVQETTTVLPKTDLSIVSKTVSHPVVDINQEFTYTVTVANGGPSDAYGVRVTDALPAGFVRTGTAISVVQGSGVALVTNSCSGPASGSNGTVTCDLGVLPAGGDLDANKRVGIVIPVRAAYQASGTYSFAFDTNIANTASIAPLPNTSLDVNSANNSDSVDVQVRKNSLTGTVYADNNLNDVIDAGEYINAVTLTLTGTDSYGYTYGSGQTYAALSATSNASGVFTFDKLPPGTWTLVETQPANYWDRFETVGTAGGTKPADTCDGTLNCRGDATGNTISGITLPAATATAASGYVFQEVQRGQLSGYVYHDANNDGDRAASGEAGIASLASHITLSGNAYNGVDVCTLVTCTVSLNASGQYSFANLPPSDGGGYNVRQNNQPTGYYDGKEQQGDLVANVVAASAGRQPLGTAGNVNTESLTGIALTPNQTKTEHNFGELLPATLSGYVFIDADADAARDAGETSGITGVTLTLSGTDDLGNAVGPTVANSAANGAYSFTGLRPGTYSVVETPPAGLTHTGAQAGSKGGTINGVVRTAGTAVIGAHTSISAIALVSSDVASGYNFGESGQGLSGHVYIDLNRNGVKEGGDPGIAGVQVTLSGLTSDGTNVCVAISPNPCAVTTDGNGAYGYPNLPASNGAGYTLTEQSQALAPLTNYADGAEQLGSGLASPGTANNDNFSGIVLPLAGAGTGYNFGEWAASLAGRVYHDVNDDGAFAGSDTGIAGVSVTLSGTTASGVNVCTLIASCGATTAADGTYSFTGLPAGNGAGYTLTETQPVDYANRTTASGSPAGSGSSGTTITGIPLTAGQDGTGYLFGEKTNSLSGFVYVDADNDGVKDAGETGIAGVSLTLAGNTASGVDVCTTTTCSATSAADGSYTFAGVRNAGVGGYTITETHPVTYLDGKETAGSQGGTVNNASVGAAAAQNRISAIAFNAASAAGGNNFGELVPASISGTAYLDANDNGLQDAGDRDLSGVAITLAGTDDLGAAVNANTSTAVDGTWSFTGLRPGTYAVTETQPVDFLERSNTVGSAGGAAGLSGGNSQFTGIVVASSTTAGGYLFGEKGAGISGYIYLDLDNDGVKDAGENPITGVTLTLSGTALSGTDVCALTPCVVTSTADGSYRFNALPNANGAGFTITETQPGYQDGKETAGSQGGAVDNGSFTNNAAQNSISAIPFNTASDATGNNFGEIGNGRISGMVYWDVNANGLRETADVLLPGISITLTGIDTLGDPIPTRTTTTAANGTWAFTLLRPGTYTVTETQPVDFAEGTNRVGTGTGVLGVNQISGIVIGGTDTADGYLFGEITNSLSGFAYVDSNNDGIKDVGEVPLSGVAISLTGTTASGAVVNEATTTGVDGGYSFSNVKNGSYTLTETQPAAYLDGRETAGSQGGTVDNASFTGNAAQNRISGITFNAATAASGNNFGEQATIDLSLNKTASTLAPQVGSSITFTVSVSNAGPSNASGVVVTDLLPSGYTFVSSTVSQGNYVSGTGLWTVGAIAKDASATLTVTATVNASGPYANTAEVTSANETDSDSTPNNHDGNEDDQKTVTPVPSALIDLSLNKTASTLAPQVGSAITFTVSVANAGPSNASGVVVTDPLPAGYTYVSSTISQGSYVSGTGLWTVGAIAKDAAATLTVTATVNASGPYANTAEVTSANETDSDSTPNNHDGNEDDQKTVTPVPSALIDLSLNKTASTLAPQVGSAITFTVSVANAGPSNASGVVVTDLLPAGYTFVSSTVSQGSYVSGSGLWTVGNIAKDAGATLTVTATVNASGPYANTAEVTAANETDSDSTPNNHDGNEDDQKTVTPVPTALIDLSLNKTASNMAPQVGSAITFTVSVANAGPSNASGVVVTDLLPAGYTFVSSTVSQGSYVSGSGLWTVGSIAKDASATLTVTATVKASGPYANTAEVTAANETDSDSTPNNHDGNEDDQKTVTPVPSALIDLSLNKTASNMAPQVGSNVTFTMSVSNAGPSGATGVQVTDLLPSGYTYVSSTVSQGGYVSGTGLWTVGSIAKDASATLTVTAMVKASGFYTNTAEVTAANETDIDSTPNNHVDSEDDQKTITPTTAALIDLSLNKTASNMAPSVGSNVTFTVSVANAGPSNATGVVVTDPLPAGYTFVSSTVSQGSYVSGSGLWTVGSLAKDASATLTVTATVNASGPYANTAEVTAANESDSDSTPNNHDGNEDDQKTVTPVPTALIDLSLNKTASNMAPSVGSNVTFTVSVANAGPSNASGVVVTDLLPSGYSFVSSTVSQGGYVSGSGLWTVGTLAKDASATLTVTATVKASGPYANTAEVTAANETDSDSTPNNHDGNEDDQKTVTPVPTALIDLSLNKTASNLAPQVGSNVTFTVSVANAGPSNASGVVVTDLLPAGYTFVSSTVSQGSYVSGSGLWTVGAIAKDASATLTVTATVNASGPYANTAEVTSANEIDSDSTPNNHVTSEDDQKTVTPVPSALIDLSLNKTASNLAPQVGSNVTFTVSVSNAGPSGATGVQVTDLLPAGYTYVSSTVSQGSYVSGSGLWTVGGIAKDTTATLTVTATVNASGPYANTAEVTSANETDSDSTPNNHDGNEDDQKTVTPVPSALIDLSLNKTASSMAPQVGSNVTFTVSVSNAGPSGATGVQVSDLLPAGYTYVSSTPSQGSYVPGTGLWTVGGIAKDASATLTVTATVNASGPYANTAEVMAANETDADSTPNNHDGNEDDQKTVTPVPSALIDLSLNKTASNLAPQVGSTVTFTVSVANAGPSGATGVVVTDLLPAGYTYVSSTVSQGGYVPGSGLWTVGAIAKDAGATLTVTGTVKDSGSYVNTAEVTSANETDSDSTPNNHVTSEDDQKTVTPVPSALIDLSLNKTASNLAPQVGSAITFTVSVSNAGPSGATGVVVTDLLPSGYTFVSSTVSQGNYVSGTGLWTVGNIAKDASATLTVTATVNASGSYANTAEVTSANETDSDSTPNNHDGNEDDQKTVTPVPSALIDLSLNKTASNMAPQVGSTITFTVSVANAGPSNASGVVVSDLLPAGYTYVSSTVSQGSYVSGSGLWTVGTLVKDASATLTVTGTVNASGPYANTAEVTSANETDSDSTPNNHDGNEDDQKTVTPAPTALIDLSLNKTASSMAPQVGSTVTFTVSVANAGPSNASGVQVTDLLPSGYTYVSSTVSQGGYVPGSGLWTVGALAKDASATLTVTATVKVSGPYANTAEVTAANETDSDSTPNNHDGNEDDQKTVTPVPTALIDLSLNKTASNLAPQVGSTVTFTVSVSNAGPSNASGVVVTDLLPAGYTYVSSTVSQGSYVSGTGLWTVGNIAKDATATLTVTATVNASGPYANTAEVTSANETDSDSTPNNHDGNEDDQKTVTPVPKATLSGRVYLDSNGNGVVDAGETGIAGVGIRLTGKDDLGNDVDITAQTDADGQFNLSDLRPTDAAGYTLTETQPAGYRDGLEGVGTVAGAASGTAANAAFDATPANNAISGIQLGAGQSGEGYLFGERGARLSGFVYVDANGNGGKDAGEAGLAGIPVTLSGLTSEGVDICVLLGTTACTGLSDADGAYAFEGLPAGLYALVEDQTAVNLLKGADDKPLYGDGKEAAGSAGGEVVNDFFGSQSEYNRIRNINITQAVMTQSSGEISGYLFGETPRPATPLVLKPPIVNGYVWLDRDHSRQRPVDGSMEGLSGWSVGLFQNQSLLCTVSTDDNGFYQFDNLHCPGYESGLPISGTAGDFSISFSKASNRLANVPISGGGAGEAKQGEIVGITLRDGDEVSEQNLPLDPSGIVYDAVTRQPVAGATVRIDYLGAGVFDPAVHLLGGTASQVQVTGVDGLYAFFLQNAYPSGEYRLTVTAPTGYLNATSVMIPVCTGVIDALALPTPLLVQGSNVPPVAGTPLHNAAACPASSASFGTAAPWSNGQETTQYYFRFNITNGVSAHILNNHIPVDPLQGGNIVMTKTTPLINVARGDLVPYSITARNTLPGALAAIDIQDLIPPGFKYKQGSASFDDDCDGPLPTVSLEPSVNVRTLTWANHAFSASGTAQACKRIKLILVVGSGVGEGEYSNQTWSMNSVANVQISNTATATVRVVPDPTFDCTDIIGKVFDDQNANGYQDEGEPGIPNARVATARGLLVTTDKDGRFHVACAVIPQAQRGSNFIMKLDERSLPSGYRLTTENPRDVRATRGKLVKLNFGAAIHRVVRVELSDAAFMRGKPEPGAALARAIEKLPKSLHAKPSIVRLAYRKTGEAQDLIQARLREVRERLERLWKEQGCCYTLVFEEEMFERSTGKQRGAK